VLEPLVPPATIGMLGGGQLGRYALMAASAMGYRTIVLDPDPTAPAAVHASQHLVAPYDDPTALARLAAECDVVTTEFENPPADALNLLAATTRVAPGSDAVAIAQDRILEKSFLADHGFPVGPFIALDETSDSPDDGHEHEHDARLAKIVSHGAVVKSARMGYDGKGQHRVNSVPQVYEAVDAMGGVAVVVESLLDLRTELSVLVARTVDGHIKTWPVAENMHVDGILDVSVVPARVDAVLKARSVEMATAIAEALCYVGVLAVEIFVVADQHGEDTLLVNELAPRPHNSGHWTLDASVTSQFEQQVRAVCGVGLADTAMTAPAVAMVNLLGDLWFTPGTGSVPAEPNWAAVLADPSATLHLYGKSEPRPARKMGHITVTAATPDAAEQRARRLRIALSRPIQTS
jgi:5-(carboxyamino)imidazole ribonucleotide synthase